MKSLITRRSALRGVAAVLVAASAGLFSASTPRAMAHEAPCPYCNKTITQDTDKQDNETVLKYGKKRIEYKCVYCALSDAKTEYKGDVTVLAPSEKKGEPVILKRIGGKWSATAEGAAFVAQKASHKICNATYRAFSSRAAAEAYIKANKEQLPDAKPLTLSQLLDVVNKVKS